MIQNVATITKIAMIKLYRQEKRKYIFWFAQCCGYESYSLGSQPMELSSVGNICSCACNPSTEVEAGRLWVTVAWTLSRKREEPWREDEWQGSLFLANDERDGWWMFCWSIFSNGCDPWSESVDHVSSHWLCLQRVPGPPGENLGKGYRQFF